MAPAGDLEAGYAALFYGADAVYLGLKRFSAAGDGRQFDEGELNEFVGFAHARAKRFMRRSTLWSKKTSCPSC